MISFFKLISAHFYSTISTITEENADMAIVAYYRFKEKCLRNEAEMVDMLILDINYVATLFKK